MTGPQFGEAVDVLFVTCRALAYWIAILSFAATVVCVVVVAGVAWAWRRAWRALSGRLRPEPPAEAPRCSRPRNGPQKPAQPIRHHTRPPEATAGARTTRAPPAPPQPRTRPHSAQERHPCPTPTPPSPTSAANWRRPDSR